MVESIPDSFVHDYGSVGKCSNATGIYGHCSTGLTETMYEANANYDIYCTICASDIDDLSDDYFSKATDAQFKCPEGKCESILSFRQFFDDSCCVPTRTEFEDLTKMMSLLEKSELKDKKARQEMDLKEKSLEDAALLYCEKDEQRRENRRKLAASFADAGAYFNNYDDKEEKTRFQYLRTLMNQHEEIVKEFEDAERKMESKKTAFKTAAEEYYQKNEDYEKIRSELSSSFTDAGQSLASNKEVEENPRDKCNVCFEKYNTMDRHFCVLQCGHPTCQKCLSEMHEKLCPICREPFTESSIIKLFFN